MSKKNDYELTSPLLELHFRALKAAVSVRFALTESNDFQHSLRSTKVEKVSQFHALCISYLRDRQMGQLFA